MSHRIRRKPSISPHNINRILPLLSKSKSETMASKFKVDQLRSELAKRGLDTTGTKPFLAQRLEEAWLKEEKKEEESKDNDNDSNNAFQNNKKKRGRELDEGNDEGSNKAKAVEEFRQMNVKQLREQAGIRGLSTVGTKKELLERLCEDAEKNSLDGAFKEEKEEEKDSSKEEKIVTATKKGAAVLDQGIPEEIKAHYHVLQKASLAV